MSDPQPDECVVVFARSRVSVTARPGEVLLEVAERAKVDVPSLCRGGTCATCKARLLEGAPKVDTLYALTKRQREQGFILTCSARATPGRIVLDL
jgi:ferredoxin